LANSVILGDLFETLHPRVSRKVRHEEKTGNESPSRILPDEIYNPNHQEEYRPDRYNISKVPKRFEPKDRLNTNNLSREFSFDQLSKHSY